MRGKTAVSHRTHLRLTQVSLFLQPESPCGADRSMESEGSDPEMLFQNETSEAGGRGEMTSRLSASKALATVRRGISGKISCFPLGCCLLEVLTILVLAAAAEKVSKLSKSIFGDKKGDARRAAEAEAARRLEEEQQALMAAAAEEVHCV